MSEVLFTNCPQCGEGFAVHTDKPVFYCPRCGVEMRPDALPAKTVLMAEDVAQLVRLKELELEQAKIADAARRQRVRIKVGLFLFLFGALCFVISSVIPPTSFGETAAGGLFGTGIYSVIIGLILLPIAAFSSGRKKRENRGN